MIKEIIYRITKKKRRYIRCPEARVQLIRKKLKQLGPELNSPKDVYETTKDLALSDCERMVLLCLNAKNRVLCRTTISIGTILYTTFNAANVLKPAILSNAVSVILVHNHPSGDPEPSKDDIKLTKTIQKACKLFEIELFDHIIIGADSYFAMHREGLI